MALWPWVIVAAPILWWLKDRCEICDSKWTSNESCLVCKKEVCGECGRDVTGEIYKDWPIDATGEICKDPSIFEDKGGQFWPICEDKGRLCPSCIEGRDKKIQRSKIAVDRSDQVEVFSKNYRGRPEAVKNRRVSSSFYRNRDTAERELKILAALEDCNTVTKAEWFKETRRDSDNWNYKYSVWKYEGFV